MSSGGATGAASASAGATSRTGGRSALSRGGPIDGMLAPSRLGSSPSAVGFAVPPSPTSAAAASSTAPTSVKLSASEIAELREVFNLVDKDGGGTISKGELADLLETLGIRATMEELDVMLREVDSDGSGDVSWSEFLTVMQRRVNVPYSADEVKAAFRVFEHGAPPGHIRVSDLSHALITYCTEKLSEDKIAELISQLEPDANGMISYVDFVNMMMS